jgi:hypothetical protein
MASFKYLLPTITIAPPRGFTITDTYPVQNLGKMLENPTSTVTITWDITRDATIIHSKIATLEFKDGKCLNAEEAIFEYTERDHDGWKDGDEVGYLETRVELDEDDQWFSGQSAGQNYTIYSAVDRKSFASPQSFKTSNPQVIKQVRAFKKWVEGYPACRLDPKSDIDLSVVLINPYEMAALITIDFPNFEMTKRVRVPKGSAKRISLIQYLDDEDFPWLGQIYVYGARRIPLSMIHHSYSNPYEIGKLEHLDPFRGETQKMSFTRALYNQKRLGRI